ncbi:MAG: hypothetical protein NT171_17330 [Planctomycetota bacterium]|nr:hypothetical protein [Planctomycetota bacterium]
MNALRFTRLATFAWACALVTGLAPSAFGEIIYTMTNASNLQNGWALSGTITVSRTGTNLTSNDITGWAFTVTKGTDSYTNSSTDLYRYFNGAEFLLATPTQLILTYDTTYQENYVRIGVSGFGSGSSGTDLGWSTYYPLTYYAYDRTVAGTLW